MTENSMLHIFVTLIIQCKQQKTELASMHHYNWF